MFSHCGIVTLWGPDAWTIIDHFFRSWLEPFLYQAITWIRADHLSNPPPPPPPPPPIMKLYHRSLDQESHRAATTTVRRRIWLYLDDNKQKTTKQDKHPKHSCTDVSSGGVFPAKMIHTRLWYWPDSVIINYYTSTSPPDMNALKIFSSFIPLQRFIQWHVYLISCSWLITTQHSSAIYAFIIFHEKQYSPDDASISKNIIPKQ